MKKSKIKAKLARIPSSFDATIHKTEWTCAAKIAEWMNTIIRDKSIPLGKAEVETTVEGDRKRVDVILFETPTSQQSLCILEMKGPYFNPLDENELKDPARKKANLRKTKYFATSNFQQLIWFNTTKANNPSLSEVEQVHNKYFLSGIEDLDLIEEPRYRNSIINGLGKFLTELYEVHTGKKAEPKQPIDEWLIWQLHEEVDRLSRYYRRIVEDEAHKDKDFLDKLRNWFNEQNWNFAWQSQDFERAARQTAYLLINKILFYNVLRTKKPELAELSIPEDFTRGGQLKRQLQEVFFKYVVDEIDYETIYSTDFIDWVAFPDNKEVVEEIKKLVQFLKSYDFAELSYDIVGRVFEKLIPPQERHNLGQYFTNPDIIDVILSFCMKHETDKVLDPACGSGTFLVRAYIHKQLMNQRLKHNDILPTIWGNDVAKFPAHLATINLAIRDLSVEENYPRVIRKDFFELLPANVEFHLPQKSQEVELAGLSKKGKKIEHPRWFDSIVGNPPFTRQEEIPTITGKTGYKQRLIDNALYDHGRKIAEISKRAGIHAYFFVHGTKFLKDNGHFGFIVSNSWLDVDYGKGLQQFFLENYKIIAIIESKVERWFEEADINTCIIILQKCKDKKEREENLVHFVYLKKPLHYFIPPARDMWEKQVERLNTIDNLRKTILAHNDFYENEELRIFPKSQKELWDEGFDPEENKYVGSKWGKYLRAPEIFFKILEKGKNKLVLLKEVVKVRRGFTTGANEFFYLTEEEIKRRGIEKEFWMHKDEKGNWVPNYVIKSPRECKSIVINPKDLKYRVLMIHKDRKGLKRTNVLKYIEEGERKGFHKRPTCAGKQRWYDLGQSSFGSLIWTYLYDVSPRVFYNPNIFVNNVLYDIVIPNQSKEFKEFFCVFSNSTLMFLFLELWGRLNYGLGALSIAVYEVGTLPFINSIKIPNSSIKSLKNSFDQVSYRPIGSIFDELGASSAEEVSLDKVKSDRRELDKIIMGEILGLTDEEQLEVYRAVVDLVKSRIDKAKSFGKKKKTKEGIDIDSLVKTITDKIGEETLGKLYKEKILTQKSLYTKKLPGKTDEIRVEKELYGWVLYSGKRHIDCASETEARYLKVWLEAGLEKVKVPKDENYLKTILPELEKLKTKIDQIVNQYLESITDPNTRSKISHQLWQEIVK